MAELRQAHSASDTALAFFYARHARGVAALRPFGVLMASDAQDCERSGVGGGGQGRRELKVQSSE